MVVQIIKDTTEALKAITDKSWILWVACLIPNVVCRAREEAEARAWEEHNWKFQEEVKQLIDEKLARVAKRDRRLKEKLTAVLRVG